MGSRGGGDRSVSWLTRTDEEHRGFLFDKVLAYGVAGLHSDDGTPALVRAYRQGTDYTRQGPSRAALGTSTRCDRGDVGFIFLSLGKNPRDDGRDKRVDRVDENTEKDAECPFSFSTTPRTRRPIYSLCARVP